MTTDTNLPTPAKRAGKAKDIRLSEWIRGKTTWLIAAAMALLTLSFVAGGSDYNLFVYNTFLLACLGAIALNVLMGTAGQVSVATAGFLALGAYVAVACERAGLGFPLSVLGGGLAAAVGGAIVALPAMRLRGLALGLGTIAAFYIILYFANDYQRSTPEAGAAGFFLPPPFSGVDLLVIQRQWAWLLTGVLALLILIVGRLSNGNFGRTLRLIRDHEPIAPTLGVNVFRSKVAVFAMTSFVIGVQGGLAAFLNGQATTETFTLVLSLQYLAMVLIGGLDSIVGSILGAAIITTLPLLVHDMAGAVLGTQAASLNSSQYSEIVYGILVLIFIVFAREGVVGLIKSTVTAAVRLMRRTPSTPHVDDHAVAPVDA